MPIDYSIPTMVSSYLSVIQQLSILTLEHDSLSKESIIFQDEIQYYLKLIREEMAEIKKDGE